MAKAKAKAAKTAKSSKKSAKKATKAAGGSNTAKITDVAEYVSKKTDLTPKQARESIKATFEGIATLLKKNERVSVTGVGTFAKTVKAAQKGGQKAKNPFTGEDYVTKAKPAQTKVKFRPGKGFKSNLGMK